MDLQMPEMDGLTATGELRKIPGYATTVTGNVAVTFGNIPNTGGLKICKLAAASSPSLIGQSFAFAETAGGALVVESVDINHPDQVGALRTRLVLGNKNFAAGAFVGDNPDSKWNPDAYRQQM